MCFILSFKHCVSVQKFQIKVKGTSQYENIMVFGDANCD